MSPTATEIHESVEFVVGMVEGEVEVATTKFGPDFASAHEAYAVLLEEVDEFKEWVWKKRNERDRVAMVEELVQVAAVAIKYAAQLRRAAAADMDSIRRGGPGVLS